MSKATSWETTESPVIKMSFEDKAMILVDEGGDDLVPKYHVAKLSIVGMTASADGGAIRIEVVDYIGQQQDVPYTRKETHSGLPTGIKKVYKQFFKDALDVEIDA